MIMDARANNAAYAHTNMIAEVKDAKKILGNAREKCNTAEYTTGKNGCPDLQTSTQKFL
jgi:hypothetical protein